MQKRGESYNNLSLNSLNYSVFVDFVEAFLIIVGFLVLSSCDLDDSDQFKTLD